MKQVSRHQLDCVTQDTSVLVEAQLLARRPQAPLGWNRSSLTVAFVPEVDFAQADLLSPLHAHLERTVIFQGQQTTRTASAARLASIALSPQNQSPQALACPVTIVKLDPTQACNILHHLATMPLQGRQPPSCVLQAGSLLLWACPLATLAQLDMSARLKVCKHHSCV